MADRRIFTVEEKKFIQDNYRAVPLVQMCVILNASKNQIDWQIRKLGLKRFKELDYKEHDSFIASKVKTHNVTDIAKMMNRSFNYVLYRLKKMGLEDKVIKTPRKPREEPKKIFIRPKAEYTNIGGYLYLLDKYSPINH